VAATAGCQGAKNRVPASFCFLRRNPPQTPHTRTTTHCWHHTAQWYSLSVSSLAAFGKSPAARGSRNPKWAGPKKSAPACCCALHLRPPQHHAHDWRLPGRMMVCAGRKGAASFGPRRVRDAWDTHPRRRLGRGWDSGYMHSATLCPVPPSACNQRPAISC
jgi:hypothetical protein